MSWIGRGLGEHQGKAVSYDNRELRFVTHPSLQAGWRKGSTKMKWYLQTILSQKKPP